MKDIDGKPTLLQKYKGKVVLVVNVASKCGLTPQYEGLEALYKEYKSKGFEILGFPANNFGGQEPGNEAEIKQFCTGKYNVTFPMFSKISVGGDDIDPLYKWLINKSDSKQPIEWNFAKFLLDKSGNVIARFSPQTKPDAKTIKSAIEKALK
jgi:glutathione peroxidase